MNKTLLEEVLEVPLPDELRAKVLAAIENATEPVGYIEPYVLDQLQKYPSTAWNTTIIGTEFGQYSVPLYLKGDL